MKTRLLALTLAALALAAAPAGAHQTRSATAAYVLGTPPPGLCPNETGEAFGVGVACFDVDPLEDVFVTLTATDQLSPTTAFFWLLHDTAGACADGTAGNCRSAGFACDTTGLVYIPGNASGIRVNVLDPGLGSWACLAAGTLEPAAATAGTITARFYD